MDSLSSQIAGPCYDGEGGSVIFGGCDISAAPGTFNRQDIQYYGGGLQSPSQATAPANANGYARHRTRICPVKTGTVGGHFRRRAQQECR